MTRARHPHPNPLPPAGEGAGRPRGGARVLLPRPSGERAGVRGPRRIRSSQLGFSLLEILVAFAIAAMALGMLYRVSGNNATTRLIAHLLAAHGLVPAQGLNESGQAAGYGWTVISRPYPTAANNATAQAAHLHEVVVDVSWQDGNVGRTFELSSLRPERKPRPGETIR